MSNASFMLSNILQPPSLAPKENHKYTLKAISRPNAADSSSFAKILLKVRCIRSEAFPRLPPEEGAWLMMLDLYIAMSESKKISVSSLAIASGLPATTALRYIQQLTDQGYVERLPDPKDRRRVFMYLTPAAFSQMEAHLEAIQATVLSHDPHRRAALPRDLWSGR